jgi:uncharacterized protein YdeI (BOF family)
MKKLAITAALGATCLALAACGDADTNTAEATEEGATENAAPAAGTQTAASAWPKGARIIEEGDVVYRIDPDGTRVVLTDTDSRIVVEDGTRFRVDPDGTRVRIDDEGLEVDLPDVDVGVNEKGNLDVDVGDDNPDR